MNLPKSGDKLVAALVDLRGGRRGGHSCAGAAPDRIFQSQENSCIHI
ncbi:hypothetical protein [Microcoleus sp. B5-D4]